MVAKKVSLMSRKLSFHKAMFSGDNGVISLLNHLTSEA